LESQSGLQICVGGGDGDDPWQAPAVAPSRSSFFRAFLETATVCPARQSVTFIFFLPPLFASTSWSPKCAMVAGLATPTNASVSSRRLLDPSGKSRTNVSKCKPFMMIYPVSFLATGEQ
jgi:hypothetical protein